MIIRIVKGIVLLFIVALSTSNVVAQISGIVFRDFNANGSKDNTTNYNEPFVQGVTVTAFPTTGASQSTTTNSSGAYSFTGLTLPVRIEFIGNQAGEFSAPKGTNNNTSVQFHTSATTTANFGVNYPDDYWDNTKEYKYIVPQYWNGLASANPSNPGLVSTLYGSTGLNSDYNTYNGSPGAGPVPSYEIVKSALGSVWGEAYHKTQKHLYLTTFLKRHVGMADGPGFIYNVDYSSATPSLTGKFNLQGVAPTNGGSAIDLGTVTRTGSADFTLSSNASSPNRDMDAFGKVGAMSFGDADIQPGTDYLWTVNLFQKALIRVDVSGNPTSVPANVEQYILSALPGYPTSSTGVLRPWALKFAYGKGYLGVVDDASTSTNRADLKAIVLEFDPNNIAAGFTQKLNFDPNPKRVASGGTFLIFKSWLNTYSESNSETANAVYVSGNDRVRAQPVLSDIEFDEYENMYVSFFDRLGHQMGYWNYPPISGSTTTARVLTYGEIDKACRTATGWEIEGTGSCHTSNAEFIQDISGDDERESSMGAVALLKGKQQLMQVSIDPHPQGVTGDTYWTSQGVNTYNLTNGQIANWYSFYQDASVQLYGKANGLGDLELLGDPAPIEIGNRVWMDTDNDGVQDADEMGLDGIAVKLFSGATLIATKTTANGGQYYFSTADGVLPNTAYTIRIEASGFPAGKSITLKDQPTGGVQDLGDNDASLVGGNADISYTTGNAGENNHTLDFGLKVQNTNNPVTCPGPYGGTGAVGDPAQWVVIGDPGNPADGPSYSTVVNGNTIVHNDPNQVGYGSVNYTYSIADGFVTIKDYLRFLNAVDPINTLNFEGDLMNQGLVQYSGGIWSAGAFYCIALSPSELEKCAVTRISLNQKARYANWVATGNVNTGAYTFATADGNANITAIDNTFTGVRLLTENEYYKAAFWDQTNNTYNLYGTTGLQANGTPIISGIGSGGIQTNTLGVVYNLTSPDPNICWPQVQSGQGGRSAYGVSNMAGGFHNSMIPNSPSFPITNDLLRPDNLASAEVGQRSSFRRNDISSAGFYPSPSFQIARTGNACICEVVVVTADPTPCNTSNNTYALSGMITFPTAPASGTLTISVPGGTPLVLSPPFLSPIAYTLTGLTADGTTKTVTAQFSSSALCVGTKDYTAPATCTQTCDICPPTLTIAGLGFGSGSAPLAENVTTDGSFPLNESNIAGFLSTGSSEGVFYTFCTEITQPLLPLQNPYTHTANGSPNGFTSLQALRVAQVFQAAGFTSALGLGAGNNTTANMVALQMAVWNAYYDTDYSISTGNFQMLTDNNVGVRAIANAWLLAAQSIAAPNTSVHRLTNPVGQDLVLQNCITTEPSTCNATNNTYMVTGFVSFANAPATGSLTVSVSGGGNQVFNAPFTSPQAYTITGLTADGSSHTVTAVFSADLTCQSTATYTAPANCTPLVCSSTVTAAAGPCNAANNQYTVTGQVTLTNPPSTGTVTVQIVGGGNQTFTLPQSSPISYSIGGQTSDGVSHTVEVTVSGVSCSSSIMYTAPTSCTVNCPSPNCGTLKSKKVINN